MYKFIGINISYFVIIVSNLVLWYFFGKILDKKENGI